GRMLCSAAGEVRFGGKDRCIRVNSRNACSQRWKLVSRRHRNGLTAKMPRFRRFHRRRIQMRRFDNFGEAMTRKIAHRTSRRSVLQSFGKLFVGSAFVMPVLPIARSAQAATTNNEMDTSDLATSDDLATATQEELTSCEYWRYCGVDGFLCTCCGGTATTCPPGAEPSPISWVGTCHNPKDGKDYMISYHDCCGKSP